MSGIADILRGGERDAAGEIEHALRRAMRGPAGELRVLAHEPLRPHVYRLRVAADGGPRRDLVLKRMRPEQSARERILVRRLLPAVGLGALAPPLAAFVVERAGDRAWHVYEDLGDVALAGGPLTPERLSPAVDAMAAFHRAFARRPELGAWRGRFGDLGIRYLESGLRTGERLLRSLPPRLVTAPHAPVRNRLLERLRAWSAEIEERARMIRTYDPSITLVHGDCHARNALVAGEGASRRVHIIDWDHAAVGYAIFDLTTFVEELPVELRHPVIERYRAARGGGGPEPDRAAWNRLFDTARIARFADEIVWDALAILDGEVEYGLGKLAMWLEAIESMRPILPEDGSA